MATLREEIQKTINSLATRKANQRKIVIDGLMSYGEQQQAYGQIDALLFAMDKLRRILRATDD
jgi:hypothetical protein